MLLVQHSNNQLCRLALLAAGQNLRRNLLPPAAAERRMLTTARCAASDSGLAQLGRGGAASRRAGQAAWPTGHFATTRLPSEIIKNGLPTALASASTLVYLSSSADWPKPAQNSAPVEARRSFQQGRLHAASRNHRSRPPAVTKLDGGHRAQRGLGVRACSGRPKLVRNLLQTPAEQRLA